MNPDHTELHAWLLQHLEMQVVQVLQSGNHEQGVLPGEQPEPVVEEVDEDLDLVADALVGEMIHNMQRSRTNSRRK